MTNDRVYVTDVVRLCLILGLPLLFNPWGASAFELPKAAWLRALVILLGWVTVLARLDPTSSDPPSRPPREMLGSSLAFGLVALGATLSSYDPQTSLWGTFDRQQGLLTLMAYLTLFWLTASQLRRRAQLDRLWAALVWGSLPVVLYGLLQGVGIRPLDWQTDATSPVLSTLGRANFLGAYLVLIVPLTAARVNVAHRRGPLLLLIIGQGVCVFLTQARGAWLGLGAALVTGGLSWAYTFRRHRRAASRVWLGLLALAFLGSLLALGLGFEHLAPVVSAEGGSVAARLTIWRTTATLVTARPWLGYGPETMWPIFLRAFPPALVYYHGRGVIVDRAHNLWLDLGMGVGVIGVLAFAALLVATSLRIRRGLHRAEGRWARTLWVALAAALVGHLVEVQVSFDLTTTGALFWLLLALVAALAKGLEDGNAPGRPTVRPLLRPRDLPATLLVLAVVGQLCVRPVLADVAYWKSQQRSRTLDTRLHQAERAVQLWPLEPTYRLGLAELHAENAECEAAEAQLAVLSARRPDDPQVWAAYGPLYVECAAFGQAEVAWRRAVQLAPNVGSYHLRLGMTLVALGKLEQATEALQRAVTLDATDVLAYQWLAEVYQALGAEEAAQEARQQAEYWKEKTVE